MTRTRMLSAAALAALVVTVPGTAAHADCAQVAQYVVTADSLSVRHDPGGSSIEGTLRRGDKFNDRGDDGNPSWRFGFGEGVGYGWVLKSGIRYDRQITVCH